MKKSLLVMLTCISTFSLVISGCGSSSKDAASSVKPAESTAATQAPTAKPEAAKKDVTITVGASQNWIKDIDRKLADQFTQKTGIKIDFQVNPDDQYINILKTKIATKEAPDILYMASGIGIDSFQPEKNFMDLSNEPWAANYTDWAKAGASIGGKIYGFNTWSVDGWGLLYNTDIFAKYNLQPPKTYAEFTQICDTLLKNGITPIFENAKDEWHLPIWLQELAGAAVKEDPGFIDKLNNNTGKFADSKVLATGLGQYNEMNKKGYFGKDALSNEWTKGYEAMGSGKYAMDLVYTTYQQEVLAKFPNSGADKWKMFPVPMGDNTTFGHSAGGIIRVVNKETKNIDSIRQYFAFLSSQDNLKAYYTERKDLGPISFKGIVVAPATQALQSVQSIASSQLIDLNDSVKFYGDSGAIIAKAMQDMLFGKLTPLDVLKKLDDNREKSFKATAK
ncbi:ABC transporter substrate-binding protein [Paenibacillus ferrarius]|nr:ABC transporter substrate-binding protein [Paenibacillus ferrarius]